MKCYTKLIAAALFSLTATSNISAHCEVPCGIYSDDTVLKDLHTHQHTISKAMKQITELSKEPGKNANQLTRWVMNKESHATKIQNTMMQYFLAQRIKLAEADSNKEAYLKKVTLAHKIIVLSMKCKQSTDLKNAGDLHEAIDAFTKAYLAK
ncbi:MAG: superoxide dismutase [Ni] [Akkermansiaceae bacterium]